MSPPLSRTVIGVRTAEQRDVVAVLDLMAPFVASGDLLPRTPVDVVRDLDSYVVAAEAPPGALLGVGSLKAYSPSLAEVQALAVTPRHQGAGIGRAVVERLITRAQDTGVKEVFALTRRPEFFERLGFRPADKSRFPSKIWLDCARCPRQDACDEVAVYLPLGP